MRFPDWASVETLPLALCGVMGLASDTRPNSNFFQDYPLCVELQDPFIEQLDIFAAPIDDGFEEEYVA